MQELNTTAQRATEVARIAKALKTRSHARVLSALGHPGYSEEFARQAISSWVRQPGLSMHGVLYKRPGL